MLISMKYQTLLIALLVCCVSVTQLFAETVYKKVNPDGSVEFTDRETKDSKEVKVHEPMTYTAPSLPAVNPGGLPVKKLSPKSAVYSVNIISPANNTTINESTDVKVSIGMSPALKIASGHQIQYRLAGQTITSQQTSVVFANVERGSHVISVNIIDKSGEIIGSATSSTIYMKRFFKKPAKP